MRRGGRRRPARAGRNRRRIAIGAAVVVAGVAFGVALGVFSKVDEVIQELTLPLRHEDIIRQQADDKSVDASLIAAVIYAESRFSDQTSHAGARGLMQITPQTAREIEKLSGGTTFEIDDLSDPDLNIRYGTYYLGELLNRYDGNEVAALAAYNAGPANVERWGGAGLSVDGIQIGETRNYVAEVLDKRREYRREYARELGYR